MSQISFIRVSVCAFALGAFAVGMPTLASAAPITYTSTLSSLNGSGVTGTASLTLNGDFLSVNIQASGLESNARHLMHIHGRTSSNGSPLPDFAVTSALDTDKDGFIEEKEAEEASGLDMVALTKPPGNVPNGYPTAPGGVINFQETYNILDSNIYLNGLSVNQLLPLNLRAIEIHGLTVASGIGSGTPGEVNGTGGYLENLPVAAGLLSQVGTTPSPTSVPEPNSLVLVVSGLLGLAGVGSRSRRR
jgi:hypothetical protein